MPQWSITVESSIAILEASFILINDVYNIGITYDNYQLIVTCLENRPLDNRQRQNPGREIINRSNPCSST
jgi:hypothetical protein